MKMTRVFGKISFDNEMSREALMKVRAKAVARQQELRIEREKIQREQLQMEDAQREIETLLGGSSFKDAVSLKLGSKDSKMQASEVKPTLQSLFVQDHGWGYPVYDVPAGERLYVWMADGPEVQTSTGPFKVPMVDKSSFLSENSLDNYLELFLWGACTAKDEYTCWAERDKECNYDIMLVGPWVREELHFEGRVFKTICVSHLQAGDVFVVPSEEYFGFMPHIKDTIGWFCMLDSIVKLNASEITQLHYETGRANGLHDD